MNPGNPQANSFQPQQAAATFATIQSNAAGTPAGVFDSASATTGLENQFAQASFQ